MEHCREQYSDYTLNSVYTMQQLWLSNLIYDDCQCSDRIGDNTTIGLLST
jgi:hypothetical protein